MLSSLWRSVVESCLPMLFLLKSFVANHDFLLVTIFGSQGGRLFQARHAGFRWVSPHKECFKTDNTRTERKTGEQEDRRTE